MSATAAADFHENWNRFMDPGPGRYLQPEPMLQDPKFSKENAESGLSAPTYSYAHNNPLAFIDPNGLYSYGVRCDDPKAGVDGFFGKKFSGTNHCQDCRRLTQDAEDYCNNRGDAKGFGGKGRDCNCFRKLARAACEGAPACCKKPIAPKEGTKCEDPPKKNDAPTTSELGEPIACQ